MTSFFNKQSHKYVMREIIPQLQQINVIGGSCRYNYQCHRNVVHDAIAKSEDEIALVFYIDEQPIIHFLNVDKDGNYVDNTLGVWCEQFDFYLIKHINKDDFFNVNKIFTEYRLELNQKLPIYLSFICDINIF